MVDVIEFKNTAETAYIDAAFLYECAQETDGEIGMFSGRYVRESDYNALLERHRRLVKAAKYRFDMLSLIDKSRGLNLPEWEEFDTLKAALAEEVDDDSMLLR